MHDHRNGGQRVHSPPVLRPASRPPATRIRPARATADRSERAARSRPATRIFLVARSTETIRSVGVSIKAPRPPITYATEPTVAAAAQAAVALAASRHASTTRPARDVLKHCAARRSTSEPPAIAEPAGRCCHRRVANCLGQVCATIRVGCARRGTPRSWPSHRHAGEACPRCRRSRRLQPPPSPKSWRREVSDDHVACPAGADRLERCRRAGRRRFRRRAVHRSADRRGGRVSWRAEATADHARTRRGRREDRVGRGICGRQATKEDCPARRPLSPEAS